MYYLVCKKFQRAQLRIAETNFEKSVYFVSGMSMWLSVKSLMHNCDGSDAT